MPQNTGYQGFGTRIRLVNGVPDGYSEPNTPGPNYVPPIYNPVDCPPPSGSQGNINVTINKAGFGDVTVQVTTISPNAVIFDNTFSIDPNNFAPLTSNNPIPVKTTKSYNVKLNIGLDNELLEYRVIVTDMNVGNGTTLFDQNFTGSETNIDCGMFNTDITVLITNI